MAELYRNIGQANRVLGRFDKATRAFKVRESLTPPALTRAAGVAGDGAG
jgi:hypothetical protein